MMELEDMRQILQARLEKDSFQVPHADLASQLNKKTRSVTSNIRQTVLAELLACACFFAAAIFAAAWFRLIPVYWFCTATVLFSAGFSFYLLKLYTDVKRFEGYNQPVKKNLEGLIAILGRFMNLYLVATLAFLPIIFLFGLFVGYIDIHHRHLQEHFYWTKAIGLYTGLYAAWSILVLVFTRRYINALYGRHLQHLKLMLKDIENG